MIDFDCIERHVPTLRGSDRTKIDRYARVIRSDLPEMGIRLVRLENHMFLYCDLEPEITTPVRTYIAETENVVLVELLSDLLQRLEGDHA